MRLWWWVIAAAAIGVLWWWRKQARAALDGTQRTVTAPPSAGTAGVQASLMAVDKGNPVTGLPVKQLPVAAQAGNGGVATFVSAFNVNSPKPAPAPPAPVPPPPPKVTGLGGTSTWGSAWSR